MEIDMEIEIAETRDPELLARLNRQIQELHMNLYPERFKSYDFEAISSFFGSAVTNPDYYFLVGRVGGHEAGYPWIELRTSRENAFCHAYRSIFVHHLHVSEGYRRLGLGSKFMQKTVQYAEKEGVRLIELDRE